MVSHKTILIIVSCLDLFSIGLVMPQLANHMTSLGGSHILIGLMGAIYSAFQLISGPIVGSLSDLRGRKPIMLTCLYVCGISYIYLGITSSIFIFLTIRAVLGLTKQTQLLTRAIAPDYVKDAGDQSALYGKMASLSGVGMSVGPIVSGHIMEAYTEHGFTIISTITALIFAINIALISKLPEQQEGKKSENSKSKAVKIAPKLLDSITKPLKESIDEFYKIDWTIFGDIFVYKLIITMSMMMYFGNFGLFLKTLHGVSPKNLGYIISFQGVTGSFCTYFISYVNELYKNDKDFTQRNLHVFVAITLSFLGMALAPNVYVYIAVLIPFAVSGSVCRLVSLEMVTNRCKSDNRGTVIGASNSIKSLSGVLVPLINGVVNQYFGTLYVYYLAATVTSVGVVISYRMRSLSIKEKIK